MMQPPNPIMQGLRSVWRDPATFLLEILWRWCFGVIALLIVFSALAVLWQSLHMNKDQVLYGLHSQPTQELWTIALIAVVQFGMKLGIAIMGLALALILIWSFFAAPVRRIAVRRLSSASPLGFAAMLAVKWARAMVFFFAVLLLMAAIIGGLYVATRGQHPDLFRLYMVSAPSAVFVLALWLVLNWHLSMAAIFGRQGDGFRAALRAVRQTVRPQRSDFAGTAFIFLLLRLLALLAAVAIIGLTSSMMTTAPESYAALVVAVALIYFVISDFLYVARIASYLALAAAAGPQPASVFTVEKLSM
jgi:hypothetical protein